MSSTSACTATRAGQLRLRKAGVIGLTKTQAREWGPLGIRANVVAFGMIETQMTSAFAEDATVEVGGVQVPQGLPAHAAKTWQREEMLGAVVRSRARARDEAAGGVFFRRARSRRTSPGTRSR